MSWNQTGTCRRPCCEHSADAVIPLFSTKGYTEVRYDEEKKRVVSEPLQLTQAFRNFDVASPWEMTGPGIETRPEAFKLKQPEPAKKEGEQKK